MIWCMQCAGQHAGAACKQHAEHAAHLLVAVARGLGRVVRSTCRSLPKRILRRRLVRHDDLEPVVDAARAGAGTRLCPSPKFYNEPLWVVELESDHGVCPAASCIHGVRMLGLALDPCLHACSLCCLRALAWRPGRVRQRPISSTCFWRGLQFGRS